MNKNTMDKMRAAGGERLSATDAARLRAKFHLAPVELLLTMEAELPLAGAGLTLSEDLDLSSFGVEMEWMTVAQAFTEAERATPGEAGREARAGSGGAMHDGSAAPYFVDTREAKLPLVRIPHDAVDAESDALDEGQIERVADSLEEFFERCTLDNDTEGNHDERE